MKQLLLSAVFVIVLFSTPGYSELLIAVPASSQTQQQRFNPYYNKQVSPTAASFMNSNIQSQGHIQIDPPIPVESKTFDIYQPVQSTNMGQLQFAASNQQPQLQYVPSSQGQFQMQPLSLHQTQDFLTQLVQGKLQYATPTQPRYSYPAAHFPAAAASPAEKKSLTMLQNFGSHLGLTQGTTSATEGRSDKNGAVTITIKLEPEKLFSNIQGQGSSVENSYAPVSTAAPASGNGIIQFGNSIAQAYNGGSLIANSTQNPITEAPFHESNGFLKSIKNLIKSQISTYMDSSESSKLKSSGSQQYAIFTPNPSHAPAQQQYQMQNIANFLTKGLSPQNNQLKSQVQIAKPINNQLSVGTGTGITDGDDDETTGPLYNAASTIMKTVSQIPSNLDLMFNDMGRVYRKNLFQIRDTLSDISSLIPPREPKKKDVNEMWLDAYGA